VTVFIANITWLDISKAIDPTGFSSQHSSTGSPLSYLTLFFFVIMVTLAGTTMWSRARDIEKRGRQLSKLLPLGDNWEANLNSHEWLKASLKEYSEQCWNEGEIRFNAHQAEDFFNEEMLLPQRFGSLDAAPGILTALGILGTFLGIVIGLMQLKVNGSAAELSGEVASLIASLGVSFRTSIWGLLLSIATTISLRQASSSFNSARVSFIHALNKTVERATPQFFMRRQLEQQKLQFDQALRIGDQLDKSIQEQTKAQNSTALVLQELITQIHSVQGEQFSESKKQTSEFQQMNHSFADTLERVVNNGVDGIQQAMAEMSNTLSQTIAKTQQSGMDDLTGSFMDKLNESFGDNFAHLGKSIDQMVSSNDSYQKGMGSLVSQLNEGTQTQHDAAQEMSKTVGQFQEMSGHLLNSANQLTSAAGSVGEILTVQNEAIERQKALSESLLKNVESQTRSWGTHQEAIAGAYAAIQQEFSVLTKTLASLIDWHDRVKDELNYQVETWHQSLQTQQELTADLQAERQHTSAMLTQLEGTSEAFLTLHERLQGLPILLEKGLDRLQTAQAEGDTQMNAAAQRLEALSGDFGASWKGYAKVATQLSESLPDVTNILKGLQESRTHQASIVEQTRQLSREMSQTVIAQKATREELERTASATAVSREVIQSAAEALKSGSTGLTQATTGLLAAAGSAKDLSEAITLSGKRFSTAEKRAQETWSTVQTSLHETTGHLTRGMAGYSEKVNSSVERTTKSFDEQISRAIQSMEGAISALHAMVTELNHTIENQRSGS
jgi:ABC-type transporter Mla subunit MlaD